MMLKKGLLIALIALVVDQVHKYWMLHIFNIDEIGMVQVTSFFNLVMVWNHGISFGMFNDGDPHQYQPLMLSLLALVIVTILLFWLKKAENKFQVWGIGLVIGGALGNVIDRTLYGAVADFLDFHYDGFHWPAFNFADSFICVGVFLLVFEGLFAKKAV
jgi:signal peptidase II